MTQTEYLASCGAPPLPKGWHYEVRYLPDYDETRDKWYTIIDVRIWDGDTLLSNARYTVSTKFFADLGYKNTLDTVKQAYNRIGRPNPIDPPHLTSLRVKEPND
jgi:hypothetical protein